MQSINTFSLTPESKSWLANSRHPRILHIFDHACNLINESREVLSIVTPQIGNGPFNLVVEDGVLFSDHLNSQSKISIHAKQLHIGELTINTKNASLWSPRPDWEMLHTRRNGINKLVLTNYQKCNLDMGLAHLPDLPSKSRAVPGKNVGSYSTTTFNPNLPITNHKFSYSLVSSLGKADLASSLTAARQLAGLGMGLTPAGDDFIMGAMLAAWIVHLPETAKALTEEISNTAAPLTTSLSAAWLRSAGRGEAGILWHHFFDALISDDPIHVQESMDKILAVGKTSGADALMGFVGTLGCWVELTGSDIN